ncbi:hypothetical protein [Cohnella thermotolerans]|uniref:hypothetical protein n=1 Tax=Cohnella thermotolerans TaxID=329858 RepID=UPI00047A6884|nr:hypothetical protein [Cohnella thermotolerans]
MERLTTLRRRLREAEVRARNQDYSWADGLLEEAERAERRANERSFMLIRRRQKNNAWFSQVISENFFCLTRHEYMTGAEKALLIDLLSLLELGTNAIVHPDQNRFCTVTEIAELLKRKLRNTRELINKLIEKGIIYEFVDPSQIKEYGRVITERPLYVNPEIAYAGDRNKVNAVMARQVIQYDHIKRNKINLPWKLEYEPNAEYARLIHQKKRRK